MKHGLGYAFCNSFYLIHFSSLQSSQPTQSTKPSAAKQLGWSLIINESTQEKIFHSLKTQVAVLSLQRVARRPCFGNNRGKRDLTYVKLHPALGRFRCSLAQGSERSEYPAVSSVPAAPRATTEGCHQGRSFSSLPQNLSGSAPNETKGASVNGPYLCCKS